MAKRTKYSVLVNESDLSNKADQNDDDNNEDQSVPKPPSPPPIFIPRVTNISDMIKTLRQVIDYNEFSHKTFPNGDVRVKVKSIDGYRALTKHLDKHNINFHTYQLKNERAYRVVLRHLHHTYCVDTLKAAIELLGHKVRNISKVINRATKTAFPSLFFVDLEPAKNNKEIFDCISILNANVSFETPKRSNEIPQCHKCQSYEHTKNYCRNQFVCVKCAGPHDSKLCQKPKDAPPKCCHCSLSHTANWKGCSHYQNLLQNKSNRSQNKSNSPLLSPPPVNNNTNFPILNRHQPVNIDYNLNTPLSGQTYAQITNNNSVSNLEQLLTKQMEKMDRLLDMVCLLINKLIK